MVRFAIMINRKKISKVLSLVIIISILIYLFKFYNLSHYLSLNGFNTYRDMVLNYEEMHQINFIIGFIVSYVILIAACIPGTIVFDLMAGFIFGGVIGSFIVIFSYASGSIINFIVVKSLFRQVLMKKFGHLEKILLKNGRGGKALAVNLIGLRFIPVIPFWLLNILSALIGISLPLFTITTIIGIIPTSVIYVMIGSGVRKDMAVSGHGLSMDTLTNPHLWAPLIILSLIILVPNLIKFIKNRMTKGL